VIPISNPDVIKFVQTQQVVTHKEWEGLRANTYERTILVPLMDDELLIQQIEKCIEQTSIPEYNFARPPVTYDQAIIGLYLPELLRRFRNLSY
jgi:hypothetical protein